MVTRAFLCAFRRRRVARQDESRLGLKTLTGKVITLQGVKPQGTMGWSRDNFYLYGLVEPLGGESFFWEFSHLDSLCFQHFLDLFSRAYPDSLNLNEASHTCLGAKCEYPALQY